MRFVAYLLLLSFVFVSFVFVSSEVIGAPCNSSVDVDSCGTLISSSLGHGAVELCSDCYVCGAADGVCPEDFYNGSSYASCSNCPDPDCSRVLTGYVTDLSGFPLSGVEVSAQIFNLRELWDSDYTVISDSSGFYSLSVPPGNYKVSFKKFGFDTRLASPPPFVRDNPWVLNVSLANGSCHADCSGYLYEGDVPRCRASCQGFVVGGNVCYFNNSLYDVASACDGVPVGAEKVLAVNGNMSLVVTCCEGSPSWVFRPPVSFINNNIKNLITQTIVAEMSGQASLVKLKIIVYDK